MPAVVATCVVSAVAFVAIMKTDAGEADARLLWATLSSFVVGWIGAGLLRGRRR